jgi:hypothetical protein
MEAILQTFLLYARFQLLEYRLRFDWPTQAWVLEHKPPCPALTQTVDGAGNPTDIVPTDASTIWTLTAFNEEHDPAGQVARFMTMRLSPEAPEGNRTYVYSPLSNSPGSQRVTSAPLTNFDSLNNPASPDYLGRVVAVGYKCVGISDQTQLNMMNRRLFEAIGRRRLKGTIEAQDYIPALAPCTYFNLRALDATGARATIFSAWIKRRTVRVLDDEQETVSYEIDTNWTGELSQ